jgi:excinuclease ABC subunit C
MSILLDKIKKIPTTPGIYLFYNNKKELLYVGKATALKSRVKSYFKHHFILSGAKDPATRRANHGIPRRSAPRDKLYPTRPIESLIHEVKNIKTIKTDSVLEAIILEGNYIKKFRPKYNIDWKDDKSWNYLAITNEKFPRLITIRQHEISVIPAKAGIQKKKQKEKNFIWIPGSRRNASSPEDDKKKLFGPFPSLNTRETLKILHKLFYISRCIPNQSKPCFDYQLGYCLGVCTGEINSQEYKNKVIQPLTEFLKGNKKRLLLNLKKQMALASQQENFEEAARLRNQIKALQHIQDITLLNRDLFNNSYQPTALPTYHLNRIEAYDISNLGSTGKVGSMVVFNEHGPVKSEYRKFKIKTVTGQSDVDCLKEVITRRLKNNWPLPDLILVDGGKPQVNAIKKILPYYRGFKRHGASFEQSALRARGVSSKPQSQNSLNIPVIGLAKGPKRQKNEFIFDHQNQKIAGFIQVNENLLIRARDEAHRFAINYQKKLRTIK